MRKAIRRRSGEPRVSPDLARIIDGHLRALRWTQTQLAVHAHVSKAQLSGWLANQTRSISRNHINRIACAIATGYGWGQLPGVDNLDGILNELLQAAGYSAVTGAAQDLVWTRLSAGENPRLKVGWVEYPPFAYQAGPSGVAGLAVDITNRVGELTGCRIEWERFEWGELIDALYKREIDVVCPVLMLLPTRLLRVAFSEPIQGLLIPINGLVPREFRSSLFRRDSNELSSERILLNTVAGEVGHTLCRIVAPQAQSEPPYTSFEEACRNLRSHPTHDGRVRCLIADDEICRYWRDQYPADFDLLLGEETAPKVKLPVAFGVHPEEKKLLQMIDTCLTIMTKTGYIDDVVSAYPLGSAGRGHRSHDTPPGHFRRLGTVHIHLDGVGQDDDALALIHEFENTGLATKLTKVTGSVAGPQRQDLPDTYESHNPSRENDEALAFFSTVDVRERRQAVRAINTVLTRLRDREGMTVEAERVVATIDPQGHWSTLPLGDVPPIEDPEVGFTRSATLPLEVHHAFDLPFGGQPAITLEELLANTNRMGIPIGGWFNFAKKDFWSYRSNAFYGGDPDALREQLTREWRLLNEYLQSKGVPYRLWTIVEHVLGVWRTPAAPLREEST